MFGNTLLKVPHVISPLRELYLDTNVWIDLAKENLPVDRFADWAAHNHGYLALTNFQICELSKSEQLFVKLVDVISQLRVVMTQRWDSVIAGNTREEIKRDPEGFMEIDLSTRSRREALVSALDDDHLRETQAWLERDAMKFEAIVVGFLNTEREKHPPDWRFLDQFIEKGVTSKCEANGVEVNPDFSMASDRYAGIQLQFAATYARYFVHGKKYSSTDYLDLLHCIDMANADTIVTEKSLGEQLRQVHGKKPEIVSQNVYSISDFCSGRE